MGTIAIRPDRQANEQEDTQHDERNNDEVTRRHDVYAPSQLFGSWYADAYHLTVFAWGMPVQQEYNRMRMRETPTRCVRVGAIAPARRLGGGLIQRPGDQFR